MKIVFLGTAAMVPTKERAHTAILLSYQAENILFDCGENTQRQLRLAGISPTKITKIFISHWHGDHVLGIPGLVQTLGTNEYKKTLEVYGPKRSKKFMRNMFKAFQLEDRIKIKVHEINKRLVVNEKDYKIEAFLLKHHTASLAYNFIEKDKRKININYLKRFGLTKHPLLKKLQQGKNICYEGHLIKAKLATFIKKGHKLSIIMDTTFFPGLQRIPKNADLLIAESTFSEALKEKAKKRMHLTSKQAAVIAKKANVKQLILTHFSQRYKKTAELENEARKIFPKTKAAEDFMEFTF